MAGKKRPTRRDESSSSETSHSSDDEANSPPVPENIQASLPEKPSNATEKSIKPMERKKKRKYEDKARHGTEKEKPPKPNNLSTRSQVVPSPLGGGLPVHLFMDLTSLESSIREAAAEELANELFKSQNEFERTGGEKKESSSGAVPLEAEKNDGLDNCSPSVRYAVRRLIRGLASSREVRFYIVFE